MLYIYQETKKEIEEIEVVYPFEVSFHTSINLAFEHFQLTHFTYSQQYVS